MINGFAAARRRESKSAVRSESPQQPIVRSGRVRCAHRKLRRLTSIVFEAIASFLCGRHFFAPAFVTRGCGPPRAHSRRSIVHMPDETTAYAICRKGFDHRRSRSMRRGRGRRAAFRVTILPLPSAKPPRAGPATDPFGCFFFDAGKESRLTSCPRASLHDSQNPGWSFVVREASE